MISGNGLGVPPSVVTLTYVGGSTVIIDFGGIRMLTDPTFDPAGSEVSPTPEYTLSRILSPAVDVESLGKIDVILVSHVHHYDNLDSTGRALLARVPVVLTTEAGAAQCGPNCVGLRPWHTFDMKAPDGRTLTIIATPARHGPPGGDRGPVIGFVLAFSDSEDCAVYISGDTVWYEGVRQVSTRFRVKLAIMFFGAAKVSVAGPSHLTMTADEGVIAAQHFEEALIVPLHFEGWLHFTESRDDIDRAFKSTQLHHRLRWLKPGVETVIPL